VSGFGWNWRKRGIRQRLARKGGPFVHWLTMNARGERMGYCCWEVFELGLGLGVVVVPEVGLPKVGLPTGVDVLLAGWPMLPALPPLMVGASEMGS